MRGFKELGEVRMNTCRYGHTGYQDNLVEAVLNALLRGKDQDAAILLDSFIEQGESILSQATEHKIEAIIRNVSHTLKNAKLLKEIIMEGIIADAMGED